MIGNQARHVIIADARKGACCRGIAEPNARRAHGQDRRFDPAAYGRYGVFSGYDRVVIYNGTRAFNITLPTGVVTDLGTVPVTSPCTCENWAYWGVAEFFADAVWLVYRQLPATGGTASNIVRVRVPDGLTQVVGSFTNLADMCSIAALPARARWYWHHEGPSQFSAFPSGEALGFCDASYAFTN